MLYNYFTEKLFLKVLETKNKNTAKKLYFLFLSLYLLWFTSFYVKQVSICFLIQICDPGKTIKRLHFY